MAKSTIVEYKVLTLDERMAVVRDFLRSAEADHYRLSMSSVNDATRDERIKTAAEEVARLQAEYDAVATDGS